MSESRRSARACPSGLLVPVRDVAGRIIALVVRPDHPGDGGKYRWVSSRSERSPDGPSPGSPAHVPQGTCGPVEVARITEGQLKSDVAFRLSGIPTIGFPGVSNWRSVLPVLKDLQVRTVRVAFDSDVSAKPAVARCLRECVNENLAAIGRAADIPQPVLWRFMAGERDLTLRTADKLLDYFVFKSGRRARPSENPRGPGRPSDLKGR